MLKSRCWEAPVFKRELMGIQNNLTTGIKPSVSLRTKCELIYTINGTQPEKRKIQAQDFSAMAAISLKSKMAFELAQTSNPLQEVEQELKRMYAQAHQFFLLVEGGQMVGFAWIDRLMGKNAKSTIVLDPDQVQAGRTQQMKNYAYKINQLMRTECMAAA